MRESKQANQLNKHIDNVLRGKPVKDANPNHLELVNTAMKISDCKIEIDKAASDRIWMLVKNTLVSSKPKSGFFAKLSRQFTFLRNKPLFIRLVTAFISVIVLTGSLNYTAAQSLPGSFLYPLKKAFENASLVISFSPASKTSKLIDQSETRLSEAKKLAKSGKKDSVRKLVREINDNVKKAGILVDEIKPLSIKKTMHFKLNNFLVRFNSFKNSLISEAPDQNLIIPKKVEQDEKKVIKSEEVNEEVVKMDDDATDPKNDEPEKPEKISSEENNKKDNNKNESDDSKSEKEEPAKLAETADIEKEPDERAMRRNKERYKKICACEESDEETIHEQADSSI